MDKTDTLPENMTHAAGPGGLSAEISGIRAVIQRLLIRLSVRKGSFLPDPELGSELYKLCGAGAGERDRLALHYAQQALLPEGVSVQAARCRMTEPESLTVSVWVRLGRESYPLEVKAV